MVSPKATFLLETALGVCYIYSYVLLSTSSSSKRCISLDQYCNNIFQNNFYLSFPTLAAGLVIPRFQKLVKQLINKQIPSTTKSNPPWRGLSSTKFPRISLLISGTNCATKIVAHPGWSGGKTSFFIQSCPRTPATHGAWGLDCSHANGITK